MTASRSDPAQSGAPLLSVIVPVYNQSTSIVENVAVIVERVRAGLDGDFEVIVVSDGSLDGTEERLLEGQRDGVRVLHYDRNLGKGYAIKVGALEARGAWIGYIDADLDLDPASLPGYVAIAEADGLDFAIGSKRHPESDVSYPSSRRFASWLFQQYVRVLLRLNVRDTQVGIKVFRRAVAEEVIPFLIVKRYAFDLELLAVARAFGFERVRELPVALDYQFAGSGVRSTAVVHALVDALAVTYRLRVLRYYQRRRRAAGAFGWTRPGERASSVTLIGTAPGVARLDGPRVEFARIERDTTEERRAAAEAAGTEIIGFLEDHALPSGNWVSATVPFLARPEVAAVVTAKVAPSTGEVRARSAAAISESRLGAGSLYFRYTPGNLRFVRDFPSASFLVRRESFLALDPSTQPEEVASALVRAGGSVVYSPEAFVTAAPERLFRPYLTRIVRYGRARGAVVRAEGLVAMRLSTVAVLLVVAFAVFGWLLALIDVAATAAWLSVWGAYIVAVLVTAAIGGLRFRAWSVAGLAALALPVVHGAYALGFIRGFVRGSKRAPTAG